MASNIGRATLKYGGSTAIANINYLVADIKGEQLQLSRLTIKDTSPMPELVGQDSYTELAWNDYSATSLQDFGKRWREVYNELITAVTGVGCLNVMFHLPLYKASSMDDLQKVYKGVMSSSLPMQLDCVGYCDDFADVLEPGLKHMDKVADQVGKFIAFRKAENLSVTQHLIVLQNTNRLGITLGLDRESLVNVITHFAISCSNYYDELFPNVVVYQDVVAFGISTIQVDKYLMLDYLLSRTLLNAMDIASVNNNDVSASYAGEVTDDILKSKLHLLTEFLAKEGEIPFSEVQKQFGEAADDIYNGFKESLDRTKSIPEKTAILATLLSKTDCELFTNSIYNQDGIRIYDLFSEGIDFFIENDYGDYLRVSGQRPSNPISELKRLDSLVVDMEAQRRDLEEQLITLGQQIDKSHSVDECYLEDGVFHFKGQNFRLMPDLEQEPLEDTFVPREGLSIPESLDLRVGFRPVQNQGAQGSCLAHAMVAIFEYAMKLSNCKELDLSEAFLYYNAREEDSTGDVSTNTDTGSRVKPAVLSLMKYGLAQEEFCRYNDEDFTTKPSAAAYEDAANRKLIKAMNVDKSTAAIKAALAEGYPVVISLALCKSFGSAYKDGYVQMPSQEEIKERFTPSEEPQERHSSHAMVIVGYSDKLGRFIVRNSWGDEWGDQGYCYIPYDYIDHQDLCQSATIFTEIASLSTLKMENIPTLSVDDQDLNVRYYITQAALTKIESDLATSRKRRNELFFICSNLIAQFSSQPITRDSYLRAADDALAKRIEEKKKRCREIEDELTELAKEQRRYNIKMILLTVGVIIATFLVLWAANKVAGLINEEYHISYFKSLWVLVPYFIYLFFAAGKQWRDYREKKHELENELERLESKIKSEEKIKRELKYKTFATYHLMQEMNRVRNLLENRYLNHLHLLNNLRAWYKEIDLMSMSDMSKDGIPIISLLEKSLLDKFFDSELKDNNKFEIDFCSAIQSDELIKKEALEALRRSLVDTATINLYQYPKIANFNMSEHIVNNSYGWLAPVDRTLGNKCASQADLFIHFSSSASPNIQVLCKLIAPDVATYANGLVSKFQPTPGLLNSDDKSRVTYITIAPLQIADCEIL